MKLHRLLLLSTSFIFALRSPSSIAYMAKNGPCNVQIQKSSGHGALLMQTPEYSEYRPSEQSPVAMELFSDVDPVWPSGKALGW